MNCLFCLVEFVPKRVTALYCSPKCRVAHARKLAREKAAEEGDPSVEYVRTEPLPVESPVITTTNGTGDPTTEYVEVTPATEPKIEPRVKLPLSETPLRADVNSLARQVIANMNRLKPKTELEHLEKNQLK